MRLPNGSGVSREAPAPFCEGLTGRFRGSTHHNLHWQLDVTFNEDKLRARMGYAAQNLSIMRRMVLNTLKLDNSKGSLKVKRKKAGWSPVYLEHLLSLLFNF